VSGEVDVGGTTTAIGGSGLLSVTNGGTVTAANAHVYASGTLTGNSSVTTTNGTTVDGTVSPKGGGGTLAIGGNLSLTSGATHATTQCKVSPTGSVNHTSNQRFRASLSRRASVGNHDR